MPGQGFQRILQVAKRRRPRSQIEVGGFRLLQIISGAQLTTGKREAWSPNSATSRARQKGQSRAEKVYHHVRRLIREAKLSPGTHIQKDEVAAELGVSLAPVSQALTRLAATEHEKPLEDLENNFEQQKSRLPRP